MFLCYDWFIHFCSFVSSWSCERVNFLVGPFLWLNFSVLLVCAAALGALAFCHESCAEARCSGSSGACHVLRSWLRLGGLRRSRARRRRMGTLHCPDHLDADFWGGHAFLIGCQIGEECYSWCSRCSSGSFSADVAETASVFAFWGYLWSQLRGGVLFHSCAGAPRSALDPGWRAGVARQCQAGRASCTGATCEVRLVAFRCSWAWLGHAW